MQELIPLAFLIYTGSTSNTTFTLRNCFSFSSWLAPWASRLLNSARPLWLRGIFNNTCIKNSFLILETIGSPGPRILTWFNFDLMSLAYFSDASPAIFLLLGFKVISINLAKGG